MTDEKMIRSENRVIAGICSAFSDKYNISRWKIRAGVVIASVILYYLPVLIYLILWLALPNSLEAEPGIKKRKKTLQTRGFIIAGILSWLIVFILYLIAESSVRSDSYGAIIIDLLFFASFLAMPLGGIVGLFIGRLITERRMMTEHNKPV